MTAKTTRKKRAPSADVAMVYDEPGEVIRADGPGCTCIAKVQRALAKQGRRLVRTLLGGLPIIQTERRGPDGRAAHAVLAPTFCPFCGKRYPR